MTSEECTDVIDYLLALNRHLLLHPSLFPFPLHRFPSLRSPSHYVFDFGFVPAQRSGIGVLDRVKEICEYGLCVRIELLHRPQALPIIIPLNYPGHLVQKQQRGERKHQPEERKDARVQCTDVPGDFLSCVGVVRVEALSVVEVHVDLDVGV